MLSSPHWIESRVDPPTSDADELPPREARLLYDRPAPKSIEGLEFDDMPCCLGYAKLFGRQDGARSSIGICRRDGRVAADDLPRLSPKHWAALSVPNWPARPLSRNRPLTVK